MSNCCPDSYDCGGRIFSTDCIKYVGDDIPLLGISNGDCLTYTEHTIAAKLADVLTGVGITLPAVTLENCADIQNALGSKEKNLINLLQVLVDNQCTLKTLITTLTAKTAYTFDLKCLTVDSDEVNDIIQALIDQSCSNKESLSGIQNQINTISGEIDDLQDKTAALSATSQTILLPDYIPVPYIGPLSNFDSTGKGVTSKGYDKVYIMNGLNGTQDWRGYSPVGAVTGVPGGTLDARVDPTKNNGVGLAPGQKFGEISHKLTTSEIPSHTHPVGDPGHDHDYTGHPILPHPGGKSSGTDPRDESINQTGKSFTGITIGYAGGSQSHNNIPPSVGVIWIVKLP